MGKNELEFYKSLAIMFLKYVHADASGQGEPPSLIYSAWTRICDSWFLLIRFC